MKRSTLAVALSAVLAVVFIAQPIFARPQFFDKFKEVYPNTALLAKKCLVCHTPEGQDKPAKKNLNQYGKDVAASDEAKPAMGKEGKPPKYTPDDLKAVAAGIKAVGSKDSNGNGKSNDDDIKAGVLPGNK